MEPGDSGVLHRVLGDAGGTDLLDVLADQLPGADLTSLLLEVMRSRADRLSPADVHYRVGPFLSFGSGR